MSEKTTEPRCWLTAEELDGLPPYLVAKLGRALATHEWEDGYDRNSSHAEGRYVAYREGLTALLPESSAEVYGMLLALHALKTLREMGALR